MKRRERGRENHGPFFASVLLAILVLSLLLPCSKVSAQVIPREEAFYMESWEAPASFNSFNPDAPSFRPFLEPLFILDAWHFEIVPWLAESYEWIGDLTLRITLPSDAAWNDGESLNATDVNYTFSLPLRRSEITGAVADLWTYLDHITVVSSTTLDFVLKAENPNKYILIHTLTTQEILPEHVWSTKEEEYDNLMEFPNTENPVGSGAYKLEYVDVVEGKTIWVRDNNYWGKAYHGLPQPKYIVNIVIDSNEMGNYMLSMGELDWSECFMPAIWELPEGRGTWSTNPPYYMPVPYMTGLIYFNYLQITGDDALNNPEVRRAIAFAINWSKLCDVAFSRLTTPANPSLLPETVPELAKYINTTAVDQYGWAYNVTRANEILDDEGYPWDAGHVWRTYDGTTKIGPYEILIPDGWSDWVAAAEIVLGNLEAIGIDIDVRLCLEEEFFTSIEYGTFEITFDQPSTWTPSIPWYTYYVIYCSRTSPAYNLPMPAYGNWGSYNNTRVDELLDIIALTDPTNVTALTALYGELQYIVLKELPFIPGWFYGPFYEYSETYWANWPTENNPYTGAVCYWDSSHGYFPMLFRLKSTSDVIACDVNLDGIVDIEDIYSMALAYGALSEQPQYKFNLDVNYDGIIDIEDIYSAALQYGQMHDP